MSNTNSNESPEAAKPFVVLDSNVIISAFVFLEGNPSEIITLLLQGEIRVNISPIIIEEVSRILREKFGWEETRIEDAVHLLRAHSTVIDPPRQSSEARLSPDDNSILDCAVSGAVDYLVTGDHGIRSLGQFQGVSIVSPAEFLELFLEYRTGS